MKNFKIIFCCILPFIYLVQSCTKEKLDTEGDSALFREATTGGFTYYQNENILNAAAPSPHGTFKLKFNAIAFSALDNTGELPVGTTFPGGSIIVKEVFVGGKLSMYAVIKKDPSSSNASHGWIWAELNTDGSPAFSTSQKGDGCVDCHSYGDNRDLVKTFDLH